MIMPSKKTCLAAIVFFGFLTSNVLARDTMLSRLVKNDKNWFRVHLTDGLLSLNMARLGQFEQRMGGGDNQERIGIRQSNGHSTLTYKQTTDDQQLTIELKSSGDGALIRRQPRGKSKAVAVELRQTPKDKVVLTIGAGDDRQVFRAADLWRLFIEQPEPSRQHLFPLLVLLRPDWKFDKMTAAVEQSLLAITSGNSSEDQARWTALVEQLGDDSYAKRAAADRELRAGGVATLRFLRQLDFQQLDAEQQFRVERIIAAMDESHEDDSPEEAAASLARDPAVWLALLGRPDPALRRAAAKQLAILLDEKISIDTAAPPDTQKEKRERLRRRIEEYAPAAKSET